MNKKAYLVTLTDADHDRTVYLIDEETYKIIDNDMACDQPVLEGNEKDYHTCYAKQKDIQKIIKKAEANGYTVELDDELEFIHY